MTRALVSSLVMLVSNTAHGVQYNPTHLHPLGDLTSGAQPGGWPQAPSQGSGISHLLLWLGNR